MHGAFSIQIVTMTHVKRTSSPEEATEAFLVIVESAIAITDEAKTREGKGLIFRSIPLRKASVSFL